MEAGTMMLLLALVMVLFTQLGRRQTLTEKKM
jgi:hypothetical protein